MKNKTRHSWTKQEIKEIIGLWENKNSNEIAKALGISAQQVSYMGNQRVGYLGNLIKEVIKEL